VIKLLDSSFRQINSLIYGSNKILDPFSMNNGVESVENIFNEKYPKLYIQPILKNENIFVQHITDLHFKVILLHPTVIEILKEIGFNFSYEQEFYRFFCTY
jgi:nicotinamide mononucleotide adenylyltransferase